METKDTFLEICSYLSLAEIIRLELASKKHQKWIRNHGFMNITVTLTKENFDFVPVASKNFFDEETIPLAKQMRAPAYSAA